MSSKAKPWQPYFAQGGIFATDGSSAWGNANRVYVKYCSSDIWSGDAPASNNTFGYTFRGSRIVTAVMNGLMQNQGLGSTPGQRLLFGGCSAGAIGAMNNIEAVAAMMPSTVQTWGFLDGAGLLDIQPRGWNWRPYLETLQSLMASMLGFTQPVFQPYCAELFPGELWKCLIGCVPLLVAVAVACVRLRMLSPCRALAASTACRSSPPCPSSSTSRSSTCALMPRAHADAPFLHC